MDDGTGGSCTSQGNRPRLGYISGRELLPDWRGLSVDLLHPSTAGMFEISLRLTRRIQDYRQS